MSFLSFMRERDAEACVLCIFEPLLLCAAAGSVVRSVLLLESYDLASRTHHQVVSVDTRMLWSKDVKRPAAEKQRLATYPILDGSFGRQSYGRDPSSRTNVGRS